MEIRNFAIIAHVDHGKSTLADRFLEITGLIRKGEHEEQFLDRNPISRERGITIKLAPVRMIYKNEKSARDNLISKSYILNLIDTPGHVDFSYEVDRTLSCVEGVILLIDATQGIQAQTLANLYKALEKNLVIIPAINKIDLPTAKIEMVKNQIKDFLGIDTKEIYLISAKTGEGVLELLQAVIKKIPPPKIDEKNSEIKGLIFDSYYDPHRGVIAFIRLFSGRIKKDDRLKLFHRQVSFRVGEVGYFTPDLSEAEKINAGEIGYIVTNLKDIHQVKVGDTIVAEDSPTSPLPGYKKVKPMVFASIFPTDTNDFENLKKSLDQLALNDSSIEYSPVNSNAFGAGFRVGFLGLLHAEIIKERLEREFNLSLVLTPPQIEYQIKNNQFYEPIAKVMILTPKDYLSKIIQLAQKYRAILIHMDTIGKEKEPILQLVYQIPLSELITDFFDNLKSVSSGYASLDWEFLEYEYVKAGRLELLLNGSLIEEFTEIVTEEKSYQRAVFLVNRLKDLIPKQQFEVKIQARFNSKIIAAAKISPIRKNVLVKSGKVLGTGDIGRKKKLLERQKEGKKRMKMVGKVAIPKEAFIKLFRK
ncbi:MAG: translation elongation factor 4 [Microgenomates group bacterium]